MKQVSHAVALVDRLRTAQDDGEEDLLESLITVQLSHSDGIRGFFVTYLTSDDGDNGTTGSATNNSGNNPADRSEVPSELVKAMQATKDADDLVSLACMNVVMPAAMTTKHQDPMLIEQSRKTAERGSRVLKRLNDDDCFPELVRKQCDAILAVATTTADVEEGDASLSSSAIADDALVKFWTRFFEKWGYEERQREDIARAVRSIL